MSKFLPPKNLQVSVSSAIGLETNHWEVTLTVISQRHSSVGTRVPNIYTGLDITVGMWISDLIEGITLQIVEILSQSDTSVTCILEDINFYNTFNSPITSGIFSTPEQALVYSINESYEPLITALPASIPSSGGGVSFLTSILTRFAQLDFQIPIYVVNHEFSIGNTIGVFMGVFSNRPTSEHLIVGYVTGVIDTNNFILKPITRMRILDSLPGTVGEIIYLDTNGNYTTTNTGVIVGIQVAENGTTVLNGNINPVIQIGETISLNGSNIVTATTSVPDLVTSINALGIGLVASYPSIHSVAQTSLGRHYGSVGMVLGGSTAPSFSINGVTVTSVTSTNGELVYGSAIATGVDLATDINNASIPNVVASILNNNLILTNTIGGAITIANIAPDNNGINFAGSNSATGLALSTSAASGNYFVLSAIDARQIIVSNVTGTLVEQLGIQSAESGQKAKMVYVSGAGTAHALTEISVNVLQTSATTIAGTNINGTVQKVKVVITEPFTNGATIQIGIPSNNSLLVSPDQIVETEVGIYIIETYQVLDLQTINVYVLGDNTGSGQATINVEINS